MVLTEFESSVNSEGIETTSQKNMQRMKFESSVNSEGIETNTHTTAVRYSLRAV